MHIGVNLHSNIIILPIFAYMQQIEIPSNVNKGYLARMLWPNLNPKSARAKFHNKLKQDCRMRFSEEEIKKIKDLLK